MLSYRSMSQPPTTKCSLLIRHGQLFTMNGTNDTIPDGAIAIEGRRIVGVGPDLEISEAFDATQTVSADGGVVHPGLVDSHLHTSYHLIRGLIPDDHPAERVFDDFERPFYDNVREEDEYTGVLLASIEMLRNGTTTFLEAGRSSSHPPQPTPP